MDACRSKPGEGCLALSLPDKCTRLEGMLCLDLQTHAVGCNVQEVVQRGATTQLRSFSKT